MTGLDAVLSIGYSSSLSVSLLSRMLAVRLEELICTQWFARVASASNLPDYPSRGKVHDMLPSDSMCDLTTTLGIFDKCADEFLVDHLKVGDGSSGQQDQWVFLECEKAKTKVVSWNANSLPTWPKGSKKRCDLFLCDLTCHVVLQFHPTTYRRRNLYMRLATI